MKAKLFISILAVLYILISCTTKNETYKIGALLPMTGSGALYGQYALEGMQIAVDEINKGGGINGINIEIVSEDNQSGANTGVSAFQSLIQKNIPVVLTEFSPVVVACAPIANQTKTVLLNCGAQSPKIRDGGPFVFSLIIDANIEAENMAKFLVDSLKILECATYVINTETGINTEKVFSKEFERLGGTILTKEVHEQGATDFRSALLKIKRSRAKAVYLISLVKESAQILKQSFENGLIVQWLSYDSFQGPDIVNIGKQGAEGAIYTYPLFDTKTEQAQNFIKEYQKKYSRIPEVFASTFYDGVMLVKQAFLAGYTSGSAIQSYFKKVEFYGITGKTEFKKGNWVEKPVEFRIVKNGEFVRY